MPGLALGGLPSLRRQHLLSEFAGIKQACPEGVFISLTPENPAIWAGVLFVRDGPYAPAVLRFQITFPDAYPRLPPLIAFTTDMFHPLITPLTTYMYTTDIQDNGTVSATDAERLPPGGFSLRHGFPEWFGRGRKSANITRPDDHGAATPVAAGTTSAPGSEIKTAGSTSGTIPSYMNTKQRAIPLYDVLKYMKSTFCEEDVLDSLTLEAAGNPGAWYAWRTHRKKQGKLMEAKEPLTASAEDTTEQPGGPFANVPETVREEASEEAPEVPPKTPSKQPDVPPKTPSKQSDVPPKTPAKQGAGGPQQARDHSEWNWDGVWELRVRKGIAASLSEAVLYGGTNSGVGDDVIRFSPMDDEDVESIKANLKRTLEAAT